MDKSIDPHLDWYRALSQQLRAWAADFFPRNWELLNFSDLPTRFVPVRLRVPENPDSTGDVTLLLNCFPASADGDEYFQLKATVSHSSADGTPLHWVEWHVVAENGVDEVQQLMTEFVRAKDTPPASIGNWFLERLGSVCASTNRRTVAMHQTRRLV